MNSIRQIVNLEKYPINDLNYFGKQCNEKLTKESILKLDNFLTKEAITVLQKESEELHKKAFYCSQLHTILLNRKNNKVCEDDPCNIEVKSDKGCVPHDLIQKKSYLNILYNSNHFKNFIKNILNVNSIYPYKDKLSSINYNYYEKSQQLGWHFDDASFAITLMVSSPNSGGVFQYINKCRDSKKNYFNKKKLTRVMKGIEKAKELEVSDGCLVLFYGRNYLHRVTPVKSYKKRVLVTLNYNLEKNIKLSENARKTFFGRAK